MTPSRLIASAASAALVISISSASALAHGVGGESKRPVDRVQKRTDVPAPTTNKIVGGSPAEPGKYPFQVALIASWIGEGEEHFGQFCGGSLIDRNWVLTAAHCVPDTGPEDVDVYIGSTVLPSGEASNPSALGVRRHVRAIVAHESYNPVTKDNDIALLRLQGPAPDQLRTTTPATPEIEAHLGNVGKKVAVIGWGRTAEGSSTTPRLMEATVSVQARDQCEANYRDLFPGLRITDNMFCAGVPEGGVDSCQGDSGGFIGAESSGSRYVQLGIVSWGIGCARPRLYGVYTRVANYGDWIRRVQQEN